MRCCNLRLFLFQGKVKVLSSQYGLKACCEQGRGKKEAKQAAAAAVLETLLANVPLEDFLHRPTKQQQKRAQVSGASAVLPLHCSKKFTFPLHYTRAPKYAYTKSSW